MEAQLMALVQQDTILYQDTDIYDEEGRHIGVGYIVYERGFPPTQESFTLTGERLPEGWYNVQVKSSAKPAVRARNKQ